MPWWELTFEGRNFESILSILYLLRLGFLLYRIKSSLAKTGAISSQGSLF